MKLSGLSSAQLLAKVKARQLPQTEQPETQLIKSAAGTEAASMGQQQPEQQPEQQREPEPRPEPRPVAANPLAAKLQKLKTQQATQAANSQPGKPTGNPLAGALSRLGNSKLGKPAASAPKPAVPKPIDPQDVCLADFDMGAIDIGGVEADCAPASNLANYHYQEQAEVAEDSVTQQFYEMMHQLVNGFDKDELATTLCETMEYLQEHDHLAAILKPEDISHFVRALRHTYSHTVARKTENKSKRAKSSKAVDEIMDDLAGLSF